MGRAKNCVVCNKTLDLTDKNIDIAIVKGNFYCIDCFITLEKEANGNDK